MANLTLLTIIITISALCVSLVRVEQEARKNMKFRPFEFGFFIEGQQHRHEKQDERGIRMGQFGFITADGIYHITVYATDENGKFKILSMKSQPYEQYLKSLEVRPGQMKTTAPPITAASRKPQTIFDFNSKACSGCSIRGEQVVTEASNQETYKSALTPFAIDPRISDGTSPTLHIIEKTLPRIFEEISENSFPRTLPIGGNNENVNAPRSGFVGPIQNKNFNRENVAINRPDRKNDLGKLGKPSNSVFSPDQSTKLPILGAKKKPSHTTIQRTFQEIYENSFPRTLPIGESNEKVNAPKSGFVGPIQNKNLNRVRAVNSNLSKNIDYELEKSSSSPEQRTKIPNLGTTKAPQIQKTSSKSFHSAEKAFTANSSSYTTTQKTPTHSHKNLSITSSERKFQTGSSSQTQNTTPLNTIATFTQTPRRTFTNPRSDSKTTVKKYATSTPRINERRTMSTESRREGEHIDKHPSPHFLPTSHRKQVSTPRKEASLKTLDTRTHTTQQHETHFTPPPPTQSDENTTKYNPAKDNTELTLSDTNPIASSTHIIPTTLKLPNAILGHKSTRIFSDSITTSAKKTPQTGKSTKVLSAASGAPTTSKPPKIDISRPTQRTDNQNVLRMSGETPNAILGHKSTRIFSDSITTSAKKAPQTGKSTKVLSAASGATTTSEPPKIDISRPTQRTDNQNVPRMSGENRPKAIANRDANDNDAGDLYRFKYILDYNGHSETGSTNGNKKGNYFIIGNDNMERVVEYIANENGFQPRIRWRKIEESQLKPKENSLKEYEFVWFNSGNHR